jgi:glycosyltransferase involved in cell wall biosynthesis
LRASRLKIVINCINLRSAGTLTTGKSFLKKLAVINHDDLFLIIAPRHYGYEELKLRGNFFLRCIPKGKFNSIWRIYFDFFYFPRIVKRFGAQAVLVLGNHAPANLNIPVLVLLRNSYYVDFKKYHFSSILEKLKAGLEILIFSRTIKRAERFVTQSTYMKERLSEVWKVSKDKIHIIPNVLSENFGQEGSRIKFGRQNLSVPDSLKDKFVLIYVSRFYLHKNHDFIIKLAQHLKERGIWNIVFLLTINPRLKGAKQMLDRVVQLGLADMVINLGEIPQSDLIRWYTISHCLFFPSYLETFGNAFIEAMSFSLPILAIDLPYARSVCEDGAIYFKKDSIEDAAKKILILKCDQNLRKLMSERSAKRFKSFPSWEKVCQKYLDIIKGILEEVELNHKRNK